MEALSPAAWPIPRRHHRFAIGCPVTVQVPQLIGGRARCVDVSLGGIRIRFADRVRPGDRLVFAADLPGGGSIELAGRVVHVLETGDGWCEAGIAWEAPPDEAVPLFEAVVADT